MVDRAVEISNILSKVAERLKNRGYKIKKSVEDGSLWYEAKGETRVSGIGGGTITIDESYFGTDGRKVDYWIKRIIPKKLIESVSDLGGYVIELEGFPVDRLHVNLIDDGVVLEVLGKIPYEELMKYKSIADERLAMIL